MGEPNAEVNKMVEETEARQSTANKNGRKAESSSGSSFFTWFMVLALLGVWTSVAVVWFELVDYDDVLARAKEFRYNISEVLQGKLRAYDADGDGDFDVEDAKVLLDEKPGEVTVKKDNPKGLAEGPAAMRNKASLDPRKPVVKEPVSEAEVESGTEPVVENEVAKGSAHEASRAPRDSSAEALEEATAEEEDEELAQVEEEEEGEATAGEEEPVLEEEELLAEEEEPETVGEEEEEEEEEAAPSEALPASVEEALETELEVEEEPEEEAGGSEAGEAVPVTEEAEEHLRNEEDADIQDTVDVTEDVSDVRGSQNVDVESEIQAPVPLPEVEESAVGSDPEEDLTEDTIDTEGELVEDLEPEKTVDGTSSDAEEADGPAEEEPREELADEEPDLVEDPPQAESSAEALETEGQHQEEPSEKPESQQEEKPKVKAKKKKPKLLNKFDRTIKTEIDAAEKLRKMGKLEEAARAFEALVQKYPQSPRSHYGKAQSEDDLAEKMRSNEILQRAISSYGEAAGLPDAPSDLVRAALKRRAERQQFLGRMRGALLTLERLVQMFPADISLKNDLGVGYLLMGDNKSAKKVYEEVLAAIPDDGFAKVHYGFILKSENKIAESIPFLREGLESGDQGTDDGRFYFHLGDALQRVGDSSAYKWYELGYQRGHFASVWQRSLYNVKGLRAQPWWTARETGYMDMVKALERNWRMIRDEALSVMDTTMGLFVPEDENLREKGEWGQFTLWQQGRKVEKSCQSVPKTCALMERYPEAIGCKRGQVKYSVMQPGTHVWPHTGPTNCRLRMHLGLVIPTQGCRIRCTNETREWEEGKVLIFDDSFEHEVWQEADRYRLIFIVDVWHPELTQYQRQTLSPI